MDLDVIFDKLFVFRSLYFMVSGVVLVSLLCGGVVAQNAAIAIENLSDDEMES